MYDSVLYYSKLAEKQSTILRDLNLLTTDDSRLTRYYLATLHRAENTDDPKRLRSILRALDEIGKDTPVILPLHPRTRKLMTSYRLLRVSRGIRLIEPASYFDMLTLEKNAKVILTDSGGVQKEAYWFRVPCVTLREETEWVETVKSGWNVLVGRAVKKTVEEVGLRESRKLPGRRSALFGDGRASGSIVQTLIRHFA